MTPEELRAIATKWKAEIRLYDKEFEKFETRGTKVIERFLDERRLSAGGSDVLNGARFNILWSNIETMLPAVYARTPKPSVSRRYKDKDPKGRVAAIILERCLEYETEQYTDYDTALRNAVEDRLLPGRGIAWVRYEPTFIQVPVIKPDPQTGEDEVVEPGVPSTGQVTEDVDEYDEELAHECTPVDYVHWKDFGHCSARTWEEVPAVWRRVYMDRDALKARFGNNAKEFKYAIEQIPLDSVPEQLKDERLSTSEAEYKMACVYEIWDKKKKRAIWLHKNVSVPLDIRPDPLRLDGFFPCPKPLYATTSTGRLVPVPDYCMYQDQAQELDQVTERIAQLQKAVKVVGVYDASQDGVKRMLNEGVNNTLIPVDTWAAFAEKGGIKGVVDFLPLDMVMKALDGLYVARETILQTIYQISGLADIIRGSTDPDETLGAQQIKANYAGLRIKAVQIQVAKFASGLMRLKGEVICNFYSAETIKAMSGVEFLPEVQANPMIVDEAIALLKDNVLRDFRIDIETDSMVQVDEQQEKQAATEFVTGLGTLLEKAIPAVQAVPQLAAPITETIAMVMRKFGAGKTVEAAWDEAFDQIKQQSQQPQQQGPDPEVVKEEMIDKRERERMQMEYGLKKESQDRQFSLDERKIQFEEGVRLREFDMKEIESARNDEREHAKIAESGVIERERISASQKPSTEVKFDASGKLDQVAVAIQDMAQTVAQSAETSMQTMAAAAQELASAAKELKAPRETVLVRGKDGRAEKSISRAVS